MVHRTCMKMEKCFPWWIHAVFSKLLLLHELIYIYIYESTATNVVMWCLACVNIKAHTCCAFARQLAKTGDQWLWPLQSAKSKAEYKATKQLTPDTTWSTRPSGAESHGHADSRSHVCRDICTQLRACHFADIRMRVLQRGNKKEGGRACMGTSLAETSFQLLP